ncbi:MAG: ABC transporter ATP-binding protein [bacterium]|nr:ABC transporter ATP-binding protein [bacterium]
MLKVENISRSYKKKKVLDSVSFEVPADSITGIIGPKGSGKSTLLKIIAGFESQKSGNIYYEEKRVSSSREKRKLFSYMPEELKAWPDYYVGEFVDFVTGITGRFYREVYDILRITRVKDEKIGNLSQEYHKRLSLYFALSNPRKIILLDEPFDGFDPVQLKEIIELIKYENENQRTFLISVHQLYDAERLCDFFIFLVDGKIVEQGDIFKLSEKYGINYNLEEIFTRALR